jgi:mono/diheme cytochrome c family protein
MKRLSNQLRVMLAAAIALALGGTACASGEAVFAANCAVCHQSDGQGVQGIYPALADTVGRYVEASAGRAYLVHVVAFGMTGAIESRGTAYNGFMQPWTQLSDAQIAAVLNYILSGFNAKILPAGFKPYTAAEVKGLRAASKSFDQVHAERAAIVKSTGQSAMLPPAERAH